MPATAVPGRARSRRRFFLGRRRVERLAGDLVDDLVDGTARYVERGRDLVDDLVDETTPLVDRALNRRRPSRKRRAAGFMLVVTLIVACAGIVAWLAWREPRDEEFARLHTDPDEPNIAPVGSDGPAADAPRAASAPVATNDDGAVAPDVPGAVPTEREAAPEPVASPMNRVPGVRVFGGIALPRAVAAPAFAPSRAPLPTSSASRSRLPF